MAKKTAADGHEYDVSATANATVAPTNDFTLAQALPGSELGNEKLEFITLVHYEYAQSGEIRIEHICKEYGYTEDEFNAYIKDVGVVSALVKRGIDARYLVFEENKALRSPLSPVQLVAANAIMDLTDTRSIKKKLQDLGVNTATYEMWRQNAAFTDYLQQRAERLVGNSQHDAMLALMDRVTAGDLKAIQYYHELTGRFVSNANQQGAAVGDVQQMIVRIIEIVIDEVDDQETALRISDRLKGLVVGNQVAGILPSSNPVIQPEIAAPREMTPEIEDLMAKGAGYND